MADWRSRSKYLTSSLFEVKGQEEEGLCVLGGPAVKCKTRFPSLVAAPVRPGHSLMCTVGGKVALRCRRYVLGGLVDLASTVMLAPPPPLPPSIQQQESRSSPSFMPAQILAQPPSATTPVHTTTQTRCRAWPSRAHARIWPRARITSPQPPRSPLLLLLLLRPLLPRPPPPPPPPSSWNPGLKNAGHWTRWSRCARMPWPITVVSWKRRTRRRRRGWAAATAVEVYAQPRRRRCASLGTCARMRETCKCLPFVVCGGGVCRLAHSITWFSVVSFPLVVEPLALF